MRRRGGAGPALAVLCAPAALSWAAVWCMACGAVTGQSALAAALGPALGAGEGYAVWPLWPPAPSLAPAVQLLFDTPQFFVMFWNTCAQAFGQVAGQLLAGTGAAWALSRLRFRLRRPLLAVYTVLMLLPFQVTMVPSYLVLDALGLMDTMWAVILPGAFSAFPVFIMAKGFDSVPRSLLEAAALDGAGYARTFWSIGLPLGMPGILSACVLCFLEAWGAVEQPMTFLKNQALWPLSLYLPQVPASALSLACAASLLMLAPAVLVFLFGQDYLELGIQSAGLKEG